MRDAAGGVSPEEREQLMQEEAPSVNVAHDQLRRLIWLAESHRNHDFVAEAFEHPQADRAVAAAGVGHVVPHYEQLPYEPRAIAVSPDGNAVAMGTKSGTIHLARWTGAGWTQPSIKEVSNDAGVHHPIRALTFLGRTLLAAGRGYGGFSLIDLLKDVEIAVERAEIASPLPWFDRFVDIISLTPDPQEAPDGPIALGVTSGNRLHVLERRAGIYRSYTRHPIDLGLPPEGVDGFWRDARLIGGVWAHDRLWLLNSRGDIIRSKRRLTQSKPDELPIELDDTDRQGRFHLEPIRRPAEYKDIRGCAFGLAVRVSDEITVLRFRAAAGKPPHIVSPQRWVTAHDTLDFTLGVPFFKGKELAKFIEHDGNDYGEQLRADSPLWLVIATSQPGLRWIPWRDNANGGWGPTDTVIVPRPTFESSTLYVQFGWREPAGEVAFLAYGLRDHEFRIAPLVDSGPTRAQIEALIDGMPGSALATAALENRGLAWWFLVESVKRAFGLDARALPAGIDVESLWSSTDASDLRSLLGTTLKSWRTAFKAEASASASSRAASHPVGPVAVATLKAWVRRILTRAHELDDEHFIPLLARQAVDFLSREEKAWHDVGTLVGFLRKWFVFGYTYAKKPAQLVALKAQNERCKHSLDAMVYGALLLQRRIDLLWETHVGGLGSAPTHWAIALAEGGAFSIHSDTSGAIHALSQDGSPLDWRLSQEVLERFSEFELEVPAVPGEGLRAIRRARAADAVRGYQRGLYARRLLLFPLESAGAGTEATPTCHVLVFAFKGVRQEDQLAQGGQQCARLVVMLLESAVDHRYKPTVPKPILYVLDVQSRELPGDFYALCRLAEPASEAGEIGLLAGTNGTWRNGDGTTSATPFVEVRLTVRGRRIDELHILDTSFESFHDAKATVRGAIAQGTHTPHNPCWSLAIQPQQNRTWVWAGFHDGNIRRYARPTLPGEAWREGGGVQGPPRSGAPAVAHPKRIGFRATAGVWSLHVFRVPRGQVPGAPGVDGATAWFLSYGTADGVVGVFDVAREESALDAHLIHTQEGAPICGLLDFEQDHSTKLIAVTQDGQATAFEIQGAWPGNVGRTTSYSGLRLDRFKLGHSARAVGVIPYEDGRTEGYPRLVVGTSDGSVCNHALVACKNTATREALRAQCTRLLEASVAPKAQGGDSKRETEGLADVLGDDALDDWLRILDVGGDHVLSFSLWHELSTLREACLQRLPQGGHVFDESFRCFMRTVSQRGGDVFRRRPFSREPMKVIWDEGAYLARAICEHIVESSGSSRTLVQSSVELIATLNDACNRWIGHEPAIEAQVLMHVFDALVNWTDIARLASSSEPSGDVLDLDRRFRRIIIQHLLQPRLNHADPRVPLEALHTLNRSIFEAIASGGKLGLRFALQYSSSGPISHPTPVLGLFDVMMMVGSLPSRLEAVLAPSRPISTEVTRFFALCLLLVPHSALIVGKVVSESRLAGLGRAIERHGEALCRQLVKEFGLEERQADWKQALQKFASYRNPNEDALSALEEAQRLPERADGSLTDADFLVEHVTVMQQMKSLSSLFLEADTSWLAGDASEIRYFRHSHTFLKWVQCKRDDLLTKVREGQLDSALDHCDEWMKDMDHVELYEPYRSRYRQIFTEWRASVQRRAREAVEMLALVEGFNRHVYRVSADDLRAVTTELALKAVPAFPRRGGSEMPHPEGLHKALAEHPLIREICERGLRLAEDSQLISILISIARIDPTSDRRTTAPPSPRIQPKDQETSNAEKLRLSLLVEVLERVTRQAGLKPEQCCETQTGNLEDVWVPGTAAVWQAILQEWARNVAVHGSAKQTQNASDVGRSTRELQATGPDVFTYSLENLGNDWVLRMAGQRGFWHSLAPAHQKRCPKSGADERGVRRFLDDLAQKLGTERMMLRAPDSRQTGGYGLFMISRLCAFIGVGYRTRVGLFDDNPASAGRRRAEDPESLPLCLELAMSPLKGGA
jgi:hypothetical protein